MARQKKTKPTNKEIVYNIALLRKEMFQLIERVMLNESVINKYIEMKKDTKKFNKYLQDEIQKGADENTKATTK
jgi:hypothetical protein|tara:strand:+ start:186 stop:407 length:222 start_codon:yes stop_codon:yes gene_type:complete